MTDDDDKQPSEAESGEDLAGTIRGWYREARDAQADWRKKARESYEFYSGHQWDAADLAKLEEAQRPVVTFNRVAPAINAVAGYESGNRQEIRYLPRNEDDAPVAELKNRLVQWVRDGCDAEDEESDAYRDLLICGMGWLQARVDYETDTDGMLRLERVPALQMYWDPAARRRNLTDAQWVIHARRMSEREIDELWPDHDEIGAGEDADEGEAKEAEWDDPRSDYSDGLKGDEAKSEITVLLCQWWERVSVYRVGDPTTGKVVTFDAKRGERLLPDLKRRGIRYVRQNSRRYLQAYVAGNVVLEAGPAPCGEHFSLLPMTGYRDESEGVWVGMVEALKDPQRWSNKFFSTFMEITSSSPKGGAFAEETALLNPRKAEEDWARPDALIMLRDGGIGKVRERPMPQYPQSIDRLLQIAVSAIQDVSGINTEFLGMGTDARSGIQEIERKRSVFRVLRDLLNSLRQYRKSAGRALDYLMRSYLQPQTVLRVAGPEFQQVLPRFYDPSTSRMDIVVDTAEDSPNAQMELASQLYEVLPALVQSGMAPPPEVLMAAMPFPESVKAKWQQALAKTQQDPMRQMATQLELQDKQADVTAKNARALRDTMEAKKVAAGSQEEAAIAHMKLQMQAMQLQSEERKTATEAMIALQDIGQKRHEAVLDAIQQQAQAQASVIKAESEREGKRIGLEAQRAKAKEAEQKMVVDLLKGLADAQAAQAKAMAAHHAAQAKGEESRAKAREKGVKPAAPSKELDKLGAMIAENSAMSTRIMEAIREVAGRPAPIVVPQGARPAAIAVERGEDGTISGLRLQ